MEPGKKISQLPEIASVSLDDYFEILDVSEVNPSLKNKKVDADALRTFFNQNPSPYQRFEGIAGENLLAHTVLMLKDGELFYYDPTDIDNYGLVIGVGINAANIGEVVDVVYFGKITSPGYVIEENAIYYASSSGTLTKVKPAEGVYQEIGFGAGPTSIFVKLGQPQLVDNMNGNTAFDGNRAIKAVPVVGETPGGTNVADFLENLYYPYLNAVISLNAFPLQIVGSSYSPNVVGVITPKDDTITARRVMADDVYVNSPAGNSVNYTAASFTVAYGENKAFRIEADVSNNGDPTTISSDEEIIEGVYPYLYGPSSNPNLSGADLFDDLTKLVQKEGTKSVLLNGTNQYFYFGYDAAYDDLSAIKDQNGFTLGGMLASLSAKSVTALGWTHGYKFYRTELTTINNGIFQFIK